MVVHLSLGVWSSNILFDGSGNAPWAHPGRHGAV